MDIVVQLDPGPEDERPVREGLIAFNKAMGGATGFQPMAVLLKDDDGAVVGGLTGKVLYDWLFIELLHIPAQWRGRGLGRQLMAEAEAFARGRGLVGIWLDTFHFQACGFYEKLGFTVFGTLDGHPRDGARYFLEKRLGASPTI